MAKITNNGVRPYHFPSKTMGSERFGDRVMLSPGETLEVPDWFLELLLKECAGWRARLLVGNDGHATIKRPRGAAGAFEDLIKAKRAEAAEANEARRNAEQRAQAAEARVASNAGEIADLRAKLSDLAGGKQEAAAEANEARRSAEQRAQAAEAQVASNAAEIAELKTKLAALSSEDGASQKPETTDETTKPTRTRKRS